jgi:hypothetical protein
MAQQIILRSDTTANWASANPVLAKAEIGYDETLNYFKIGDGVTPWNSLSFTNIPNAQAKTSTLTPTVSLTESSQVAIGDNNRIGRGLFGKPSMDRWNWFQSDFTQSTLGDLVASVTGTGASAQAGTYGINSSENAQGVLQVDTGTTAAGRAGVGSTSINHMWNRSSQNWYFGARLALEALSAAAIDSFTVRAGFGNTMPIAAGDSINGAYFRYNDAVNGGRWECVTVKANALSAADSGVVADINYSVFEIDMADTSIRFYINGVLVHEQTDALHIPVLPSETFGFGWKIEKSAGTNQRNVSADWYYVGHVDQGDR